MNNGWIKLHRTFFEWEWYQKSEMVHLFVHLLLKANHKQKKWQGITINTGQVVIGRRKLSKELKISEQTIRTCLERLKSTNEITIIPTNRNSIITICNYKAYQSGKIKNNPENNPEPNQQLTSNQPTTNHKQEGKECNKEKNDKKEDIYVELFKFWNEQEIIIHKKLTDKMKLKMRSALKDYSLDDIEASIQRYSIIVDGDDYYFNYTWGLADFLQRGIEKFNTDICFKNFKKDKK